MIKYAHVQEWVDRMAAMCQPDSIYWCDGGEEERQRLTAQAVKTGELMELNQESCRAATFTGRRPTMWPAPNTSRTSVPASRATPDQPTIG